MLQITVDVFSGRPNPTWILPDERMARQLLRDLTRDRSILVSEAPAQAALGLRGVLIEPLSDEVAQDFEFAGPAYLALGPRSGGRARELAERLFATQAQSASSAQAETVGPDDDVMSFLGAQLDRGSGVTTEDAPEAPAAQAMEGEVGAAATCLIESGAFNPGFWNNDSGVRSRNNCYNYASNKRTDTFAQPGRGCGNQYRAINCAEMRRASLCDGLHPRFTCFPDSEKPRYLVALVVAPGPGFIDFHWYRRQKEGFWGHKPGGTAARNTDNSNRVITDPATCDRGPYTQFCGYFYTCRSQRIR